MSYKLEWKMRLVSPAVDDRIGRRVGFGLEKDRDGARLMDGGEGE